MDDLPPCRHFAAIPPSRCLAGRRAPHDCVCAAYADDIACAMSLAPDDTARREAWANATAGRMEPSHD